MNRAALLFLAIVLLLPTAGVAEVLDSSAVGFTSRNAIFIPSSPAEVYSRLVQEVDSWWSSDHTFSGSAQNLRIEARQGGCFCETLPNGGSVRHLTVVNAAPGKLLRLTGSLGPLQATATTGAMTWTLAATENGTDVTVTYTVGGYVDGGLDGWAEAVDGVVGEQLGRLARFIVSGSPEMPQGTTELERGESSSPGNR